MPPRYDQSTINVNNIKGKYGESLARSWFREKGYILLESNWRFRNWEIDLVATKDEVIHFIEVKTRTSRSHGYPEESVTRKKLRCLLDAAEAYIYLHPGWKRVQFDIMAISLVDGITEYFLIEDVYE
jgi:putative endonuclease